MLHVCTQLLLPLGAALEIERHWVEAMSEDAAGAPSVRELSADQFMSRMEIEFNAEKPNKYDWKAMHTSATGAKHSVLHVWQVSRANSGSGGVIKAHCSLHGCSLDFSGAGVPDSAALLEWAARGCVLTTPGMRNNDLLTEHMKTRPW